MSPTFGVGSLTALATARSARCDVVVALALLLPVTGSNWSDWEIVAVLVWASAETTWASMRSVWAELVVTVPTVQTPLAAL